MSKHTRSHIPQYHKGTCCILPSTIYEITNAIRTPTATLPADLLPHQDGAAPPSGIDADRLVHYPRSVPSTCLPTRNPTLSPQTTYPVYLPARLYLKPHPMGIQTPQSRRVKIQEILLPRHSLPRLRYCVSNNHPSSQTSRSSMQAISS